MMSHVLPPCCAGREERPAATGDFLSTRTRIDRTADLPLPVPPLRFVLSAKHEPDSYPSAGPAHHQVRRREIERKRNEFQGRESDAVFLDPAEARTSINPWSPPSPTPAVLNPGWTATSPNRTVVSWFHGQTGASHHRMIGISAVGKSKCAVLQQRSIKLSCWLDRLLRVCAVKLHRAIPMCSCEMCGGGRLAARPLDVGGRASSRRFEGLRKLFQHVRRLIVCTVVLVGSSHATAVSYWLS